MEQRIAKELGLDARHVRDTLALLDEGNTVPFIARYRKERTGNLDEVQIRDIAKVAGQIRQLEDRRAAILKSIEEQGKLTAPLKKALQEAQELARLEDLYAPFRPRRVTRAKKAIEAGLEPVATAIKLAKDFETLARDYVCDDFPDVDAVIGGAQDIIAEEIADDAKVREYVRGQARRQGRIVSKKRRGGTEDPKFEMYLDFVAPLNRIKPHQVLAMRRGEEEKVLSAGLEVDDESLRGWISRECNRTQGKARKVVEAAIDDSFKRLLHPAVERDVRGELETAADAHAIGVFSLNLKNLLLQPPLVGRRVLGIDPGMRTGCKMVAVDETGRLLGTGQIFIHDNRKDQAASQIAAMVKKFGSHVIAIGNGTGGRETEDVVATAIRGLDVQYLVVDEAGASVYSASDIARLEFPDMDVSVRGAVSIARRVQDPLAELVKIDPKSIGVGMYQHDVNQVKLQSSLDAVVEDVVNGVGVDLNSASQPLLARVAGIGPVLAQRIVDYREENGKFQSRDDLKKVKGLGAKTFEQCAGFLRIRDGKEPLDSTGIHPENYKLARAILKASGSKVGEAALAQKIERLKADGTLAELARTYEVGQLTLDDVLDGLVRPGRDPRESLAPPILRTDVLSVDDLHEGMRLKGTVRNVVDFGAFVDIGVKQDGLVHVSEMADRFVQNPYDVVSVGDQVNVVITTIDKKRGRIGLSMKL